MRFLVSEQCKFTQSTLVDCTGRNQGRRKKVVTVPVGFVHFCFPEKKNQLSEGYEMKMSQETLVSWELDKRTFSL